MEKRGGHLFHMYVPEDELDHVDLAARDAGVSRSEWLNYVFDTTNVSTWKAIDRIQVIVRVRKTTIERMKRDAQALGISVGELARRIIRKRIMRP